MSYAGAPPPRAGVTLADYLAEARALLADPPRAPARRQGATDLAVGPDFQALRWFLMPDEAAGGTRGRRAIRRHVATPGQLAKLAAVCRRVAILAGPARP